MPAPLQFFAATYVSQNYQCNAVIIMRFSFYESPPSPPQPAPHGPPPFRLIVGGWITVEPVAKGALDHTTVNGTPFRVAIIYWTTVAERKGGWGLGLVYAAGGRCGMLQ